ncbi:MAG: hypothetical protein J6J62_06700 [Oscillospiraceae bacterium]|nr:hypothetical protein [Oscillospiraceae bacterium]
MKLENMLKACGQAQRERAADEEKLRRTVEKSKAAFWQGEESGALSWLEFLYQQCAYIQKRWWLAQGLVLFALWLLLYLSQSDWYQRRCMGVLTPFFVILILPELWKNRSSNAMEVEGAAYFPLRKIYAARLIIFGMADVCLLTVFCTLSAFTLRIAALDFLVQFILPLNLTCGVCFTALQSRRNLSLFSGVVLCTGCAVALLLLVLNDEVYRQITAPVWLGILAASFAFAVYSAARVCRGNINYCETLS